MEDREALKRQIELLQNLINSHKSVHGDTPSPAGEWWPLGPAPIRGRGRGTEFLPSSSSSSFPARSRPYGHHTTGRWRKTYSLSNKSAPPPGSQVATVRSVPAGADPAGGVASPSLGHASQASSSPAAAGSQLVLPLSGKETSRPLVAAPFAAGLHGNVGQQGEGGIGTGNVGRGAGPSEAGLTASETTTGSVGRTQQHGREGLPGSRLTSSHQRALKAESTTSLPEVLSLGLQPYLGKGQGLPVEMAAPLASGRGTALSPRGPEKPASARVCPSAVLHIKPRLQRKNDPAPALAAPAPLPPPPPPPSLPAEPSLPCSPFRTVLAPRSKVDTPTPPSLPSPIRSQFTWVKSSGAPARTSTPRISKSQPTPSPGDTSAVSPAHPGRRAPPKTPRYTWVSSSARLPRKPLSPKALDTPQRATAGGGNRKPRSGISNATKQKKGAESGAGLPASSQAHSSRYSWKAATQDTKNTVRGGSVYRWTSEKENGPKEERGPGPPLSQATPSPTTPSPSGFKLRSRMKIIRRRSSGSGSGSGSERRASPGVVMVKSRYSLRRRAQTPSRSPAAARKAQSRGLVSIGRHKLRRLSLSTSPTASKTGPSSPSLRSPAAQRVIKTRYKIVTRRGSTSPAHAPHLSPALSWRAKRVHSARVLLQGRLRTPPDRSPTSQQWRGKSMRWIGGALYRVSANKLCRTVSTSPPSSTLTPRHRAGRWSGPPEGLSPSSLCRASVGRQVSRWAPSRAVQRSLAIVRHARQRKQQNRQYCMYYNRFGKCNRGQDCPYIHDPDKVAVCTRFLRGTCKQTDGTCPFSHKVSKEKMPVCSYFLKGVCSNSSCPYSHVYVSRTAAVCQDFVRGYCPQGEKCKKKHTLLCPDFSSTGTCPRGSKCKLQHRQRAKRARTSQNPGPAKQARTQDAPHGSERTDRTPAAPSECPQAGAETPASGPEKLPSFILLSSSPEPPEREESQSDTPPAAGSEVVEKKLQIKPRF
ncbi:zinc finger CCCH domain-containing protein 3 [Megalops cyprinoides]|uniref:zinc finger CCCH domain-containing protein 3 n=1 Tax=Megalops cyprinoides TaxID=118141 RepID=UPI001863DC8D|nr:zinc finger CCCH domain-containing protein 3 [Megalops cyprinoides]